MFAIGIGGALAIFVLVATIHFYGGQLGMLGRMAEFMLPGIVSSESFKRELANQSDSAYDAYCILGNRYSPIATEIALKHLDSKDAYLWLNSAIYLGRIGNLASIPYLVKSFRHTAWRGDDERRWLLVTMTGEDFGTDFEKWRSWWLSKHPDFKLDWESDLGFRPRLNHESHPGN